MNESFALNEHCFLVGGAKRGAIYDLKKGDIFSINEDALKLLELCESGFSIKEIIEKINFSENESELLLYFNSLKENNIGIFLNKHEQIKKIDIGESKHKIDFMWLEVTNKCNLKCIHCYNDNLNKHSCFESRDNENRMRVIADAYNLGCRKIQFIGGEPFLLGDRLLEMTGFAKNKGYDFVEVFTNGMLVEEKQIDFLVKQSVSVAVSFYGQNSHIHSQVTLDGSSFDKTVDNLKKMKKAGLKIRIGLIIMDINQDYIKETVDFLKKELMIDNVTYDIVRPVGKGVNEKLIPIKFVETYQLKFQKFSKCSLDMFRKMKNGHNCFSSKICITANGEVIPCIMEREIIFGNAFKSSLESILENEKNKQTRNLSKDFIDVCRDCEYRYGCFDCRPKAKKSLLANGFFAKPQECSYDPYVGKWIGK